MGTPTPEGADRIKLGRADETKVGTSWSDRRVCMAGREWRNKWKSCVYVGVCVYVCVCVCVCVGDEAERKMSSKIMDHNHNLNLASQP